MSGELSLNKLVQDKQHSRLSAGDQIFLDFLEYAGTTIEELRDATKLEDLIAQCEGASTRSLTKIFEFWSQNDALAVNIMLNEGRQEDPPPFNAGRVAKIRVENKHHRVSVPLTSEAPDSSGSSRSDLSSSNSRSTQGSPSFCSTSLGYASRQGPIRSAAVHRKPNPARASSHLLDPLAIHGAGAAPRGRARGRRCCDLHRPATPNRQGHEGFRRTFYPSIATRSFLSKHTWATRSRSRCSSARTAFWSRGHLMSSICR